MENAFQIIILLMAGGLIVLIPLFIMLVYKVWKENPNDTR